MIHKYTHRHRVSYHSHSRFFEFPSFAIFLDEYRVSTDTQVEAFLDGSFTKHSSNSGFVADDVVRTWDDAGMGFETVSVIGFETMCVCVYVYIYI